MWESAKRWSVGLVGVTVIVTVLSLLLLAAPADARTAGPHGTRVTHRWKGALNTSSLDAVNASYWSQYAPKVWLPITWIGGSTVGCLPGVSGADSNDATLSALNYVRRLAGLAPVAFSPTMNASAQLAALMMDANDQVNHYPGSNWRCWSAEGAATAARANLAMVTPELRAGQIVDLYMDEPGAANYDVGHRRWLLNPFSTVMGNGSTNTTNALTVIGPTSRTRPNPRYVPWPTAGYFPKTMEPEGRWSLGAGLSNVNFRQARVAVYRNGTRVPVTKYPVRNGYAQPTLVWQLGAAVPKTGNFRVVVTNIKRKGARPARYAYTVRLFTPYQ